MASPSARHPWPALVGLLALLLLAGIVWWRVLNRSSGDANAEHATPTCSSPTRHPSPSPVATLPAPGSVTVAVLNSTRRTGIAGAARTTLRKDGFTSPRAAANDKPGTHIKASAEIRFGPNGKQGATLLHYYFPGARMVRETKRTNATVVVSLGDKYRGVAAPSAVRTALGADRVGESPGPGSPPNRTATC